jgi:hypothetical protein
MKKQSRYYVTFVCPVIIRGAVTFPYKCPYELQLKCTNTVSYKNFCQDQKQLGLVLYLKVKVYGM